MKFADILAEVQMRVYVRGRETNLDAVVSRSCFEKMLNKHKKVDRKIISSTSLLKNP